MTVLVSLSSFGNAEVRRHGQAWFARLCLAAGADMVVVTDSDQKVLTVENPDALKGHEGHHIAVTGHVTGDKIHVESAKMLIPASAMGLVSEFKIPVRPKSRTHSTWNRAQGPSTFK